MRIYIDSANLEEIQQAADFGIIDGVTTNPSLIAKEGRDHHDQIRAICGILDGDISAEVVSTDTEGMVAEGRDLAKIHDSVVVKIPLIRDGIKAVGRLASEGIRTNVTLCFSPLQALLAAKAGAYLISPFIGRLDDLSQDGMDLVREIVKIYDNYGYSTQVLAASARGPLHVKEAALAGAHVCTLPYKVFDKVFDHPLTEIGLEKFLADYRRSMMVHA
ncbi:MAG: fructose-6-phosphate aldolase [Bryobacterales bacterium]|nr:fructose-6-phosphate aldolase [Bryobacterales bacterium]